MYFCILLSVKGANKKVKIFFCCSVLLDCIHTINTNTSALSGVSGWNCIWLNISFIIRLGYKGVINKYKYLTELLGRAKVIQGKCDYLKSNWSLWPECAWLYSLCSSHMISWIITLMTVVIMTWKFITVLLYFTLIKYFFNLVWLYHTKCSIYFLFNTASLPVLYNTTNNITAKAARPTALRFLF